MSEYMFHFVHATGNSESLGFLFFIFIFYKSNVNAQVCIFDFWEIYD